jgi:hypothetical protein
MTLFKDEFHIDIDENDIKGHICCSVHYNFVVT